MSRHASEIRQNAAAIAQGMLLADAALPQSLDITLEDGPLGFGLEGSRVIAVDPEGQVAQQLQEGDVLVAIEGEVLPKPPATDSAEEADMKMKRLIRRRIKDKPRPLLLTFERVPTSPGALEAEPGRSSPGDQATPLTPNSNAHGPRAQDGEVIEAADSAPRPEGSEQPETEGCEPNGEVPPQHGGPWDLMGDQDMQAQPLWEGLTVPGSPEGFQLRPPLEEALRGTPEHSQPELDKAEEGASEGASGDIREVPGETELSSDAAPPESSQPFALEPSPPIEEETLLFDTPPGPLEDGPREGPDLGPQRAPEPEACELEEEVFDESIYLTSFRTQVTPGSPRISLVSDAQRHIDLTTGDVEDAGGEGKPQPAEPCQPSLQETSPRNEPHAISAQEVNKELEALQGELASERKRCLQVVEQAQKLQSLVEAAKKDLALTKTEASSTKAELQKATEREKELLAKCQRHANTEQELVQKNAALKSNLAALAEQVAAADRDAKEKQQKHAAEVQRVREEAKSWSSAREAQMLKEAEEKAKQAAQAAQEELGKAEEMAHASRSAAHTELRGVRDEVSELRQALQAAQARAIAEAEVAQSKHLEVEAGLQRSRGELRSAVEQHRKLERELGQAHAECQELLAFATQRDDKIGAAQALLEGRVRALQDQLQSTKADLEVQRQVAETLHARAIAAEERCAELAETSAVGDEEQRLLAEAASDREKVLEDELLRLRASIAQIEATTAEVQRVANQKAAEAETQVEQAREQTQRALVEVEKVRGEAAAAEGARLAHQQALEAMKQVEMVQLRGEVEQAKASSENYKQLLNALRERLAEQQQQAQSEIAELQKQLNSVPRTPGRTATPKAQSSWSRSDSKGAASSGKLKGEDEEDPPDVEEGDVLRVSREDSATSSGPVQLFRTVSAEAPASEEVALLRDRLNYLERRCRNLQKKLDARPIILQASSSGEGPLGLERGDIVKRAAMEPWLREVAGPVVRHLPLPEGWERRITDAAVPLWEQLEQPLRGFTQRLLRRDAWLCLFFAHLLVLYTVVAIFMARLATDTTSPSTVDISISQGAISGHPG